MKVKAWRCPNKDCLSTELSVSVGVFARLSQAIEENENQFETEIDGGDHEWDQHSTMSCNHCGFVGEASEFEYDAGKPKRNYRQPKSGTCVEHECDNCGATFKSHQIKIGLDSIPDLLQRLTPGGTVPFGECPDCGAFVYPVELGKKKA